MYPDLCPVTLLAQEGAAHVLPYFVCFGHLEMHLSETVQIHMHMSFLHSIYISAVLDTCTCQVAPLVPSSWRQRQTLTAHLRPAQVSALAHFGQRSLMGRPPRISTCLHNSDAFWQANNLKCLPQGNFLVWPTHMLSGALLNSPQTSQKVFASQTTTMIVVIKMLISHKDNEWWWWWW